MQTVVLEVQRRVSKQRKLACKGGLPSEENRIRRGVPRRSGQVGERSWRKRDFYESDFEVAQLSLDEALRKAYLLGFRDLLRADLTRWVESIR